MSTPINYSVPGLVPQLTQPKPNACWATVNTMLVSWKYNASYTIEGVMDWLKSDFRAIYEADTGLGGNKNQEWATANGMQIEYERCETPMSILTLLQNYGPLIVMDDENNNVTDANNKRLWCVHARVIQGISGDADDNDNVMLDIVDPGTGTSYKESFSKFESKLEAMSGASNYNILMVHYPMQVQNSAASTTTTTNTPIDAFIQKYDLETQLKNLDLANVMLSAVEANMTLLIDTKGKGHDTIITDTKQSATEDWCGFTAERAFVTQGMSDGLKPFFPSTWRLGRYIAYKDDANKDLYIKDTDSKISLFNLHSQLNCLRKEFTVQDVVDGKETPLPGDIILYNWRVPTSKDPDHIQMVYRYNSDNNNMVVIEGNGLSFIPTDDVSSKTSTSIGSDGLNQSDRLQIVRTELNDNNWNLPKGYTGTYLGITAFTLNQANADQNTVGHKVCIVKFIRPSLMDFLKLDGTKYAGPFSQFNK